MVRDPLRQSKADLKRAKDTFERIHEIVVLYSPPFLIDMSSANLLWKRLHSSAMPLVVVKSKSLVQRAKPCSRITSSSHLHVCDKSAEW